MTVDELRIQFDQKTQEYEAIRILVEGHLGVYARTSGRGIVRSYTSRIKEWSSFLKKVEQQGLSGNKV